MNHPIVLRRPLGTVFVCPFCKHSETGRHGYDKTRAYGRIRTHIASCAKKEVAQ